MSKWGGKRQKDTARDAVLDAHGSRCWICGRHIDRAMPYGTPGAFSLDHVVPYSQGGSSDPENLRPAHERCNKNRGAPATERKAA